MQLSLQQRQHRLYESLQVLPPAIRTRLTAQLRGRRLFESAASGRRRSAVDPSTDMSTPRKAIDMLRGVRMF